MSKAKSTLKFSIGTLLGILLVLIPFNFNGTVDTVLFYYLKVFIKNNQSLVSLFVMLVIVMSAVMSLYDLLVKPTWIQENPLLKNIFSTTPFYVANRFIGAIVSVSVYFNIGPAFLISADTGQSMFSLATQLTILIPCMFLMQTLILEFGAMEFIGDLVGFVVKPIFKVSEIAAVSIMSAWVGPGNAAILGTQELFEQGYFTVKEVATIGSQFATSSIGWIVLISSVFDLMDYFPIIFLTITIIGVVVAMIGVRIPPVSLYPDTYFDGSSVSPIKFEIQEDKSVFTRALNKAQVRADSVTIKNFTAKIKNMLFYVVWLQPIIVAWGTIALVLSIYTPILEWVAFPILLILNLFNVAEAPQTAVAIISGLADNYLPIILGGAIVSKASRFIIVVMSILQIVFLSEIATLLLSTKALKNFKDIMLVFLIRTFVSLPLVILVAKLVNLS